MRAILYLDLYSDAKNKIGVNVIAEKLDVPMPFLSKILQELVKNKLLNSSKGKSGGFYLTKRKRENNLRSIIELFDGAGIFESCSMGLPECSSSNPCPLHRSTVTFRNDFAQIIEYKSIKEVANHIKENGLQI